MTRRYVGPRKNPYLKDVKISDEAKYQIDVLIDEARTKHAGSIKAKKGAFELDREKLIPDNSEGMKPDSARFEIDLENDLNGSDVTKKMLEEMSYSPSYRPNGKVGEQVSDITVSRLRYSALAGRKARAPKDLSFLSDPKARDDFDQRERDGKLRRDTKRSEIPVEQRRAELIEMLPKEQQEKCEDIAAEVNERREKKEIAHGKIILPKKKSKYADPEDEALLRQANIDDPTEDFRRRVLGSENREDELPSQDGMEISMTDKPQFYSETRHWSRIESENPTWSEIQQNTDIVIPQPKGSSSANEGRFVSDEEYDPENRYKEREGVKPREMPQQREGERYDPLSVNPYAADTVLSPDEIKKILGDDIRRPGELTLPENVTDPGLRMVWEGTYGMRYRKPEEPEPQFENDFDNVPRAQQVIGVHPKKQKHTVSPARHRGERRERPADVPPPDYRSPFTMGYEAGQLGALDEQREELERQRSDLARQREQLRRVLEEHEERKAAQEEEKRIREETKRRLEEEKLRRDEERYRREEREKARKYAQRPPQRPEQRPPQYPPYPPYPPPYPPPPGQQARPADGNAGKKAGAQPPFGYPPPRAPQQPPFPWGPPPGPAAPKNRGVPPENFSRTGGRPAKRG